MFLSKISQNQIFVVSFLAHVTMTRPRSCSLLWLVLAETTTTWTPLRTWTPPEVTGCWCMEAAYSYCSGRGIYERNGPTKQLPFTGTVLFGFFPPCSNHLRVARFEQTDVLENNILMRGGLLLPWGGLKFSIFHVTVVLATFSVVIVWLMQNR